MVSYGVMKNSVFTIKFGGEAGQGQGVSGATFSKVAQRSGYHAFVYTELPSLIRGGHVTTQVTVSEEEIHAAHKEVNVLVALNREVIDWHLDELTDNAVILFDSSRGDIKDMSFLKGKKVTLHQLPLSELVQQVGSKPITANVVMTAAIFALVGFKLEPLNDLIKETFTRKGEEIVQDNYQAAKFGYAYGLKEFDVKNFPYKLKSGRPVKGKILVDGNQGIALGAMAAGCKFYAGYPMTPSSSILHNLAGWAEKSGMIVKHAEDEIAVVHMAIGASFAGVRSMTSTSGGGFALMSEAIALAGITETPLVAVLAQRAGPATGLPTWTEQGDLHFALHAGPGEFPRILLAPGDPKEAFELTILAHHIAEVFQVPVILLSDKYVSENPKSVPEFDQSRVKIDHGKFLDAKTVAQVKDYKRYELTKDGVSARVAPGTPGAVHLANSDEHDEHGFSIEGWQPEIRKKMVDKRYAKVPAITKLMPKPKLYGVKSADVTLVGWGSTKGPVLEAMKEIPANKVNFIHFTGLNPLDKASVEKILQGRKKIVTIENNHDGQLAQLLGQEIQFKPDNQLLTYSGRQFYPEEIIDAVKKL
ncbi:MAG: 2-oxoacid:acceptor oxidoreductase subunit alpha [Candidatus Buchananbacteria bacterium CG10_big_fil_rev_8_21_14_0_10_42_9]|uniref:2-oxoacid:acceptor oxidoreductase subunit alpha n=1 Tax=Candidatus Buchananbacteria bacterium CG10_big_fil_rev_8_21_14_0_10_42_9 TaxID=1974526 RepID=A0A2H0W0P1_9BACT|nr:MAG: 2-oxoacid:acceptor oxidoreductase subunit alpha [Candidatus Buchananbacteria bacterium CG10_big_fil_rev_8_21_14_0_10_42_9]